MLHVDFSRSGSGPSKPGPAKEGHLRDNFHNFFKAFSHFSEDGIWLQIFKGGIIIHKILLFWKKKDSLNEKKAWIFSKTILKNH